MGQKSLKANRRALRKTAKEEKNNIISRYMTDNWDKVLTSSVALIRQFSFKNRFSVAMTILFRPIKKPKESPATRKSALPGQKPEESGAERS